MADNTKNKLQNVADILIAQLETLSDDDLDKEQIEKETEKAKAMVELSQAVVNIGLTQLKAMEVASCRGYMKTDLPRLLSN